MNEKEQFQNKIQSDPLWFLTDILWSWYWEAQEKIIKSVFENQRTTAKSCHWIGKTYISARIILAFLFAYDDAVVVTTAPTFRQVENVLWKEIANAIRKSTVPLWWRLLKTKYEVDDKWFAIWLSSDKEDNFQGFHSTNLLVVVDEAWWVKEWTLKVLEALLTSKWTRLLYVWNPTSRTWWFFESFNLSMFNKFSVSVFDTPNFIDNNIKSLNDLKQYKPEELLKLPIKYPYLVTPIRAYQRIEDWGEDTPFFKSRVLAQFPEEWDKALISVYYLEKAIQKEFWEEERKRRPRAKAIWIDVARYWDDSTVLTAFDWFQMIDFVDYKWKDTMKTVWQAIAFFNRLWFNKWFDYFIVDDTWVWWGVTDRLIEQWYNVIPVNNASSSPDEMFRDLKAYIFWQLRLAFIDEKIKIIDKWRYIKDLSSVEYDYMSWSGKLFIRSKKDMKKDWLNSPDFADSLALAFYWITIIDWPSLVLDDIDLENWETIAWNLFKKNF